MDPKGTVFIIDDEAPMRELLALEVGSAGFHVQPFASAEKFLAQYGGQGCGCILLDMRLPGMSGLELLETLRSRQWAIPVIMISAFGNVAAAVLSMKLGAVDFLEKPFSYDTLVSKVSAAMVAHQASIDQHAEASAIRQRLSALTPRELELLAAVCAGKASKVIAVELGISERTVEKHRASLLAKTGAQNVADMVRMRMIAKLR